MSGWKRSIGTIDTMRGTKKCSPRILGGCRHRILTVGTHPQRCCSSVVEHSLGKGEVASSILASSTSFLQI